MYQIQYRLLTDEEKELFYQDFIYFLSVHGIEGEVWEKMKKEDPKQATLLFAQFSDLILHKSLENIENIWRVKENTLEFISLNKEEMTVFLFSFTDQVVPQNITEKEVEILLQTAKYNCIDMTNAYSSLGREKSIFNMMYESKYQPTKLKIQQFLK